MAVVGAPAAALAAAARLPPPGALPAEVLLRRMLDAALRRPEMVDVATHGPDWRSDPKFHALVEVMQERLYELQQREPDRPPPDVLHLYSAAVSALAEELRPLQLPVYCLPASALDRAATVVQPQPASPLTGRGSNAPASAADDARPGLAATRGASLEQPDVRLSSTAQERLRTQRQLQDDLAGELLGMGAELKASTLAMQSAIRYRGKLLDEAESALVDSAANAHAVASKAKEQHRRGRWGLCQTLVLLLATALIFCAMVVWIKLTSMAGLGRRPRG